jgi:hypothetical protein
MAGLKVSGKRVLHLAFHDEEEAALAYDRAVLHYLGPDAPRNFPRRRSLTPMSSEELRDARRDARKKTTTSRYHGVYWMSDRKRWKAVIYLEGGELSVGDYNDELAAARARDRAFLAVHGPGAEPVNFPREIARGSLTAVAAETIRQELALARKSTCTSKYRGVHYNEAKGLWNVSIGRGTAEPSFVGSFDDEESAAVAYDRVALHLYGANAERNFPELELTPARVTEVRHECWLRFKENTTSQYTGVYWSARERKWKAQLTVASKTYCLGTYDDEIDAADAYDRAALRLRSVEGRLNFPPQSSRGVNAKGRT